MTAAAGEPAAPLKTPLNALHESLGARLVPFAGYAMPLQYASGIIAEHVHTRTKAGLFDVSHMGQVAVTGKDAAARLESLMPIDVAGLNPGRQRYGFLTNADGGIVDDVIVANTGFDYRVVVNAAHKDKVVAYLRGRLAPACKVDLLERALLAVQGPSAAAVVAALAPDSESMAFMDVRTMAVAGIDCLISRSGYTGEDGFEISAPADAAEALARALLAAEDVAPIGLGARDSLRLEAGLCLHGNDIDAATTPVEAGLVQAISKARRPGGQRAGGYPGAELIAAQLEHGTRCTRVALLPNSRSPIRAGTRLSDADGNEIGRVTSGGYGPTLGRPVAMGYVPPEFAVPGTRITAAVRGNDVVVDVTAMPVVPHRYRRRALQG